MDGAHLREASEGGHEALLGQGARSRYEDDEHLACVAPLAHDEMAQVALLRLLVEGRETLRVGPGSHLGADRVSEIGGEPAALDVEDFVPATRFVKAEADSHGRRRE